MRPAVGSARWLTRSTGLFTHRGAHMIRSLIRTTLLSAAFVLAASVAHAAPSSPAEVEGNKMEKKGNAEEKAANADKAKGAKMEKKGKAMQEAGDKNDN